MNYTVTPSVATLRLAAYIAGRHFEATGHKLRIKKYRGRWIVVS